MFILKSKFASILKNNSFLFIPSCLIVRMIAETYAEVIAIAPEDRAGGNFPKVRELVKTLTLNLGACVWASGHKRIGFFIGDWSEDYLRARALYFNLATRLTCIAGVLSPAEREMLARLTDAMRKEWARFESIMEQLNREARMNRQGSPPLHAFNPDNVPQTLAPLLQAVNAWWGEQETEEFLVLLCSSHIRGQILEETAKGKCSAESSPRLDPAKMPCLSNGRHAVACSQCAMFTDRLRQEDPVSLGSERLADLGHEAMPRRGDGHAAPSIIIRRLPRTSRKAANWRRKHSEPAAGASRSALSYAAGH